MMSMLAKKFIHDLATPISTLQFVLGSLDADLKANPGTAEEAKRLAKAMLALNRIVELTKNYRTALDGDSMER